MKNKFKIFLTTVKKLLLLDRKKNPIQRLIWRIQFIKVQKSSFLYCGRCVNCDASNSGNGTECSNFGCPCDYNQQLKRVYTFKFLY